VPELASCFVRGSFARRAEINFPGNSSPIISAWSTKGWGGKREDARGKGRRYVDGPGRAKPRRYPRGCFDVPRYMGRLKFQNFIQTSSSFSSWKSGIRSARACSRRTNFLGADIRSSLSRSARGREGGSERKAVTWRKQDAKSPFVCGLRNRKKRQFTLLRARAGRVGARGAPRACTCL
jgi:hypothetical protein